MSNECVISFLFENSKTIEKPQILEYQERIQLALYSLPDAYGFEFRNPIEQTADPTNQQEISVNLSVLKPNVMRDDIFFVISQLQEGLSDLPVVIRLVSDDIQQSEFSTEKTIDFYNGSSNGKF
uniref:Uncharacterized protein n=1 Tax=Panagrolaimus sp. JU765 TaxID=591449 RepID=A0AC34RDM6_9BILA